MVAAKGNDYAKKLKTMELKKAAFESYCAHLARGKSKKSWVFRQDDVILLYQAMDAYIQEDPQVFSPVQVEAAKADGYQHWEEVVEQSAKGINEKANTASLQMVMRNKFGWDKQENINKESKAALVEKFLTKLDQIDTTSEN